MPESSETGEICPRQNSWTVVAAAKYQFECAEATAVCLDVSGRVHYKPPTGSEVFCFVFLGGITLVTSQHIPEL